MAVKNILSLIIAVMHDRLNSNYSLNCRDDNIIQIIFLTLSESQRGWWPGCRTGLIFIIKDLIQNIMTQCTHM